MKSHTLSATEENFTLIILLRLHFRVFFVADVCKHSLDEKHGWKTSLVNELILLFFFGELKIPREFQLFIRWFDSSSRFVKKRKSLIILFLISQASFMELVDGLEVRRHSLINISSKRKRTVWSSVRLLPPILHPQS